MARKGTWVTNIYQKRMTVINKPTQRINRICRWFIGFWISRARWIRWIVIERRQKVEQVLKSNNSFHQWHQINIIIHHVMYMISITWCNQPVWSFVLMGQRARVVLSGIQIYITDEWFIAKLNSNYYYSRNPIIQNLFSIFLFIVHNNNTYFDCSFKLTTVCKIAQNNTK